MSKCSPRKKSDEREVVGDPLVHEQTSMYRDGAHITNNIPKWPERDLDIEMIVASAPISESLMIRGRGEHG